MKFETTTAFDGDYWRLEREQAVAFKTVVREKFAPACTAHAQDPSTPSPNELRVESVRAAPGVLRLTWSFASPDGRATFEPVTVVGGLRCRWRRVGDHDVFQQPLAPDRFPIHAEPAAAVALLVKWRRGGCSLG